MPNNFTLTLDTTAPASCTIVFTGNPTYISAQIQNLTIGNPDGTASQMKIWGDIDGAYDPQIQSAEGSSAWITYATSKQIKVSAGDGPKTIYLRVRDDVYNASGQSQTTVTYDGSLPVVNITGPDVDTISEQVGKNVCSFSFTCTEIFDEYKVKVVAAAGNAHDTGVQIGTTNSSTNMAGAAGDYPAATGINCTITGADLKAASAGDGDKIIKVFCKDKSGQWSS